MNEATEKLRTDQAAGAETEFPAAEFPIKKKN